MFCFHHLPPSMHPHFNALPTSLFHQGWEVYTWLTVNETCLAFTMRNRQDFTLKHTKLSNIYLKSDRSQDCQWKNKHCQTGVRTTKQNNLFWHNHLCGTNACVLITCEITVTVLVNNGTKQMKSSTRAHFPGAEPQYFEIQTKVYLFF